MSIMNSPFMCNRTGEACPTAELCEIANAPLVSAAKKVRDQTTGRGKSVPYIRTVLEHELRHTGETMGAEFAPAVNYPDVTICPGQIIERVTPASVTQEQIASGVGAMAAACVNQVIRGINIREAQRNG